ncbi:MAG: (Fe-S)-binding protein [Nitrospinota bacterium]
MATGPSEKSIAALEEVAETHGVESPRTDLLLDCIHCGLCLSYCPTYAELGNELDSPRGRIYLMRAITEGRIDYTPIVRKHLDLCLGCRACETACPSGVQYGRLIEAARTGVEAAREREGQGGWVRKVALRRLLPYPKRLAAAAALLSFYQRSGLQRLLRSSGVLKRMGRLGELEGLSPSVTPLSVRRRVEAGAPDGQPGRASAALLTGCVTHVSLGQVNLCTVRVLAENGHRVLVPAEQLCCGALHGHSGDRQTARTLARKNIDTFVNCGADFIVTNSAGCGSMMKEYGELLEEDEAYREKAAGLAAKVRDISEFLVEQGFRPPAKPARPADGRPFSVTYHEACHLAHGQKVRKPPREILRSLPASELRELAESDFCCGSAGTYNLTQPEMAGKLLERKIGHILDTGATVVATGNPGCIFQLANGLEGKGVRVVHPIELLAEAYDAEGGRSAGP